MVELTVTFTHLPFIIFVIFALLRKIIVFPMLYC